VNGDILQIHVQKGYEYWLLLNLLRMGHFANACANIHDNVSYFTQPSTLSRTILSTQE